MTYCFQFLEVPKFCNVTLKCITQIVSSECEPKYNHDISALFAMVIASVDHMFPQGTHITEVFAKAGDASQEFALNLALFLTSFLSKHLHVMEMETNRNVLLKAHFYMVKISQVDDRETFRICLEYWSKFLSELIEETASQPAGESGQHTNSSSDPALGVSSLRKNVYADVLSSLRPVIIERMVEPEEV